MAGVDILRETMTVGDYTARHRLRDGVECLDSSVVERKGLGDLFTSFSSGYDQEKAKWTRAQAMGLTYILAIEGTVTTVLAGHTFWKGGELREAKKSGLAMLRQLCSIQRRYQISVWFCASRKEMAMLIQEYFLAAERMPLTVGLTNPTKTTVQPPTSEAP